ncbi:ATP-binding cassette domain-containing protein [Frankia sp. CNm7]|uniref:ATP-binding cassette domain-containing protein n=1 Tax=Frankia nepalensis TaxID=1836974 RepID=A0A937RND8_9ACTN|nr:ATP-binding cassette domain-containing protein [Frankia nepalensis]MBL7499042.1 ATP-binding cassette domain-containing protein [Frankia nepalensis]MBL7515639.1 ATP-binding cassette domain-containing protein [Frankia nepalensis]MBL7520526.1 ATP-binding cassette domain-containing protein [Frankia nepalensis]MBL7632050.1 ATP-binding cassette domain-containing protein [Frankia nepalensis]
MIEARGLTKRYGEKVAVEDLSFTARPGVVTGFLGPNGAGKSTTMRMILGLDRPTRGEVRVNGLRYQDMTDPLCQVGALLEARAVHTGRSARNHLLALAQTHGISARRVDEVIGLAGLTDVAGRRVGGFSLGMGQRLGIASALLGDPATIILDEPVNGLDPEGIRWIRNLLSQLATEGRTVFLSSHLMSEMALVATHLVVVGRGRLIAQTSVADFIAAASPNTVRVRSPQAIPLREALAGHGVTITATGEDTLEITGRTNEEIGEAARACGIALYELTRHQVSLEDAFMDLTRDAVEYHATNAPAPAGASAGRRSAAHAGVAA